MWYEEVSYRSVLILVMARDGIVISPHPCGVAAESLSSDTCGTMTLQSLPSWRSHPTERTRIGLGADTSSGCQFGEHPNESIQSIITRRKG